MYYKNMRFSQKHLETRGIFVYDAKNMLQLLHI